MAKIAVQNFQGKKVEDIELSDKVFGVESNDELLHQVYVAIAANKRQVIAHTKDMSEVSGSGKKPWKQKGTGSARVGSVRNPLWRKGGVVFGPTKDRNFKKNVNIKMKRKAVTIALSEKVRSGNIIIVDEIKTKEVKTKLFSEAIANLKVKGTLLVSFDKAEREYTKASRNIEKTDNVFTENMNVFDILNHKNLLMSKHSVKYLEEKYA